MATYDPDYWKTKKERQRLIEDKPDRKGIFNRMMAQFFFKEDEPKEKGKHTRSLKERMKRRQRHKSMMRNQI